MTLLHFSSPPGKISTFPIKEPYSNRDPKGANWKLCSGDMFQSKAEFQQVICLYLSVSTYDQVIFQSGQINLHMAISAFQPQNSAVKRKVT